MTPPEPLSLLATLINIAWIPYACLLPLDIKPLPPFQPAPLPPSLPPLIQLLSSHASK
jgi:hypothetical protein